MSKIDTLKDKNGELVYPKTIQKAIYDDNGINLDRKVNFGIYNQIISSDIEGNSPTLDNTLYNANGEVIHPKTTVENVEGIGNFIETLSYSKVDTVHKLSGLNSSSDIISAVFTATESYISGDTITIDDVEYSIQLSDGGTPSDNLFVAGCTIPIIVDTIGKKINFKSGGGYVKGDIIAAENFEYVGYLPEYGSSGRAQGTFGGYPLAYNSETYINSSLKKACLSTAVGNGQAVYPAPIQNGIFYLCSLTSTAQKSFVVAKFRIIGNKLEKIFENTLSDNEYFCAFMQDFDEEDFFYAVTQSYIKKVNMSTLESVWTVSSETLGMNFTTDTVAMDNAPGRDYFVLSAIASSNYDVVTIRKSNGSVISKQSVSMSPTNPTVMGIIMSKNSEQVYITYYLSSSGIRYVRRYTGSSLSDLKNTSYKDADYNAMHLYIFEDSDGYVYLYDNRSGVGTDVVSKYPSDLSSRLVYAAQSDLKYDAPMVPISSGAENKILFANITFNSGWYKPIFAYTYDNFGIKFGKIDVEIYGNVLAYDSEKNELYGIGTGSSEYTPMFKILRVDTAKIKILEVLK